MNHDGKLTLNVMTITKLCISKNTGFSPVSYKILALNKNIFHGSVDFMQFSFFLLLISNETSIGLNSITQQG